MEVSYGIGVKNRYSLFMCDEVIDPLEIISKPQKENIKLTANTNVNVNTVVNSSKAKVNKKPSPSNNVESKLNKAKIVNGASNLHSSASKNKSNTGSAQKFNANNAASNKSKAKDSGSHSTSMNTSNRKGADKSDRNNRPIRQDKKTINNFGGSFNCPTTQDGSKNQGESGNNALRHQRDMEERKNRRNREDRERNDKAVSNFSELRERGDEVRSSRGRGGRGGFRGRGRGRGGSFDNRGKREFDRHSGSDKSGVKPTEKREGSGAFNWGNPADDFAAEVTATLEEIHEHDENAPDNSTQKATTIEAWNATHSEEKTKEVVDDALREMTLDEWKKQEQEKRILPNYNLRKGGEGEEVQWRKGYVLKRKEEQEEEEEKVFEEVEVEEDIKHGRQKRLLDIEIKFKDENRNLRRGRGTRISGRGGRGSGRGGRGEDREFGDSKGNRRDGTDRESKEQAAPKVDDWNDFPSLTTA